jgi:subtilisin family serine protease
MKRLVLLLLLLSFSLPNLVAAEKRPDIIRNPKKIPDQYIVVLGGEKVDDVDLIAGDLTLRHQGRIRHVYRHTIKGFAVQMNERQAQKLAEDPSVAYVAEDGEVSIDATQTGATWGLDRIDQRDLPLSTTYTYNASGAGVRAYIIDTGIRVTHADFGGRAIDGFDAIDGALPAADCHGHGTHVAATVGGSTWGVAKGATLVAVRVLNCQGSGSESQVIAGVDWVTSQHVAGALSVANMSLGGSGLATLDEAVRRSIAAGVTYAIAAGNSNADACSQSPARVAEAITVGASNSGDSRSSFSNWGTCLDIFAPGEGITSAWSTSDTATNTISGTSMASPHVAGAAALFLSATGASAPAVVAAALTDNATLNHILNPGSGSPNRLLYSAFIGGPGAPPPSISGFSPVSGPTGTTVRIDGTSLTGAFSVRFNGQAASFTVLTETQIDAVVPNCSSSGAISVSTVGGTAVSSTSFAVTGCPSAEQLLLNPGFELGNNGMWTATAGVIVNSAGRPARTGTWKAWLGGWGMTHTDFIYQSVAIPAAASQATLSFWIRIDTAEYITFWPADRLRVQISTNGGASFVTLATYSNVNANPNYTQKTFNLTSYKGQTVMVRLLCTEDWSLQTSFVVDDTSLQVTY